MSLALSASVTGATTVNGSPCIRFEVSGGRALSAQSSSIGQQVRLCFSAGPSFSSSAGARPDDQADSQRAVDCNVAEPHADLHPVVIRRLVGQYPLLASLGATLDR